MFNYMREMTRVVTQLRERTGGARDAVAALAISSSVAATSSAASQAGAPVPTDGGALTITPANPLSYTEVSNDFARIDVANHTRTGAAASLIGQSVSDNVLRDAAYYVYYVDAANAGGSQIFLASSDLAVVTGTAGYRIIGSIYVAAKQYIDRGDFR